MGESPAPVQAPRAVAVTGCGEGVDVVQFQHARKEKVMTLEIRNGKNAALESKEACTSLDAEIGCVLSEIMEKLKGSVSRESAG